MAVPGREPMEHPEREESVRSHGDEPRRPYVGQPSGPAGVTRREPSGYFDIIRWGPVFAGVFTTLAIMMMLGFFGAAVGLSAVGADATTSIIASAVWTIISLMIGLFFGGWLAAATSGPSGVWDGVFHGIVVWGLTMFVLAIAIALGIGGLFGAFAVTDTTLLAGTAWGLFFASLLGLISAIVGGIVGAGRETYRV